MFFFILEKLVLVQPFTKILLLVTLIYFILFSSLWCSALLSLYAQLGEITHMYEVLSSVVIPKKTSFSTFLSMYFIIYYSLIIQIRQILALNIFFLHGRCEKKKNIHFLFFLIKHTQLLKNVGNINIYNYIMFLCTILNFKSYFIIVKYVYQEYGG